MRRLTHFCVLAAFLVSCGGHWYVLQGLAWVNMIREYSQYVPLSQAVNMTLSGKYPCALCRAIAEKQADERLQLCSLDKYEKKFFPPVTVAVAVPPPAPVEYPPFSGLFQTRRETPPTPPPRFALA